MSAADILSRLDGVRDRGEGRWIAKCPAHEDRAPSLTIARADDRWLVHCFAGCYAVDIVRAIGLELRDLFDDRQYRPRGDQAKPRLDARDALAAIGHEVTVVTLVAAELLSSRTIDADDWQRLATAYQRITHARDSIAPTRIPR